MLKDKANVVLLRHFPTSQLQGAARPSLRGLATLPTCSICSATLPPAHTMCLVRTKLSKTTLNEYEIKMAVLMTVLPRQMCQLQTSDMFVHLGRMLLEVIESETRKQSTYHRAPPTPLPLPERKNSERTVCCQWGVHELSVNQGQMLIFGYFKKPESGVVALPNGTLSGGSDVQLIQSLCSSVRNQYRPGSQPDLQKVCATTTMCGLLSLHRLGLGRRPQQQFGADGMGSAATSFVRAATATVCSYTMQF